MYMRNLKILFFILFCCLSGNTLFSQSEMSAIRLSEGHNNNIGSARYQAMAGSMGAIGVEYSALNTNPAGLCLYRSGVMKTSLTFGLDTSFGNAKWYGRSTDYTQNNFRFDEFSIMSSFKSSVLGVSWGFGMQRGADFDRNISINGDILARGSSIADYAAGALNRYKGKMSAITQSDFDAKGAFGKYPWLPTLAARNVWISSDQGLGLFYFSNFRENPVGSNITAANSSFFDLNEIGKYSMKYNCAFGLDITKSLHMGFIMNFYSLNYDLTYFLEENHRPDDKGNPEKLSLTNTLSVKGGGADFGVGMIVEPFDGLRLGFAAFTPTYYSLKEHFFAKATSDVLGEYNIATTPNDGYNAYEMSTPWRLTFSAAYIWGHRLALNFDYEASFMNTISLAQDGDSKAYSVDNSAIKEDFRGRNTFRIGAEINATNRLAFRTGFAYTGAGFKDNLISKDNIPNRDLLVSGTQTYYSLNKGTKNIAFGVGYKVTPRFSVDISVSDNISDDLVYAFPVVVDPSPTWETPAKNAMFLPGYDPILYKRHLLHGALSFSYKF